MVKLGVRVLADHVLTITSEHTGSGLIDEGDRTGEINTVNSLGSGIENQSEFFSDLGVLFFGELASHELAHLVGDAHREFGELFIHGFGIAAEQGHHAKNSLKQTERNGERAVKGRRDRSASAREFRAFGYILDPLRRAGIPNTARQALSTAELHRLAEGLKL